MTMTVWVVVYTLSLCVMLLCGLVWYQTMKARQYLAACTNMQRSVKIKRAALIEIINQERVRHKRSNCACARYALRELRQSILTDILTPLAEEHLE